MYLIFDTETTGLPKKWNAPFTDVDNWPRCVQIAWQIHDQWGELIEVKDFLIRPDEYDIPYDAEKIHGISTLLAQEKGHDIKDVLKEFKNAVEKVEFVVGQNVGFDINIMSCELHRYGFDSFLIDFPVFPAEEEVNLNYLTLQNFILFYLALLLKKHITQPPMLSLLQDVF